MQLAESTDTGMMNVTVDHDVGNDEAEGGIDRMRPGNVFPARLKFSSVPFVLW